MVLIRQGGLVEADGVPVRHLLLELVCEGVDEACLSREQLVYGCRLQQLLTRPGVGRKVRGYVVSQVLRSFR